uniref:hypothetical chloroplast RF66 n=1 Tax=Pleurozia subinflata TaxID=2945675 RepID=UPI0026E3F37A|nr:hypothetical chloroplast RF66 [Pleurozia subinflata]URH13422.1 hypothetical chloroplast RF66 [Pleurozia subinflata]
MNHMELSPSTVIGVALVSAGILLYALRIREPNVSRYYDFFFSSIGLLCGGILFFQGWRLDPILLLSQILLSGTTIFFIAESLYLRNGLNYGENEKTKNIGLNFGKKRYIYQNLKLGNFPIKKKGCKEIRATTYISYEKEKMKKGH